MLSLSLLALASTGFSKENQLTLTHNKIVKAPLFNLMKTLGYSGENDLTRLNSYAQKNFLRPKNVERWNVYDDKFIESHREIIIKTLDEFGFFKEVTPELDQTYENVLILGASVGRMRSRVAFFNKLVSKGLSFKNLYFLSGERPLDPKIENESILFEPGPNQTFRESWQRPKKLPKTESDGARLAWDQLMGPDEKPTFVDVPMNKDKRPSTGDTIHAWLEKNPTKGRTLVISNNPYIPYQHAVVLGALINEGFLNPNDMDFIRTVGTGTKPQNERLRVLLDNLARTLYSEKMLWEAKGKLNEKQSNSQKDAGTRLVQVLVDKNFRGDENQVLGLKDALIASGGTNIDFKVSSYDEFKPSDAKTTPDMLMISGSTGLSFLQKQGKKLSAKTSIIWSGHQVFAELNSVTEQISLLVLPKHAVNPKTEAYLKKRTKLILVDGVPHRIMSKSLKLARQDYEKKNGALPLAATSEMLGIVLPGDAPDEKHNMLFFTPTDAKKLARNIVAIEGPDKHYLITNGPRTGSHDYTSKKKLEPSPHRSEAVDKVTSAFMEELRKSGVRKASLYDFQFSKLPSAYQPLLSLAAEGMRIHIPGESTSMVTESTDVANNVIIDQVPSMNVDHKNHIDTIRKRGAAHFLTWEGKLESPPKNSAKEGKRKTPAEVAAKEISKFFSLN